MPDLDLQRLAFDLRREVEGDVRFDPGSRHLYATDASHYRHVPLGVVLPRHGADVEAVLGVCSRHGAPVTMRGGGTSLAGQAANEAVVVDVSRHLDAILDLDVGARTARVQPGVVLSDLQAAARPHGLAFGPDPTTADRCTLGGMLANDACGVHSVTAGRTSDNVRSLEVVLADGARMTARPWGEPGLARRIQDGDREGRLLADLVALRDAVGAEVAGRFPTLPRRVSGYALDALLPGRFDLARALVGTEGTCAVTLEAEVDLVPWAPHRGLVVVGYDDVVAAGAAVPGLLALRPAGLEGIDGSLVPPGGLGDFPGGAGWLFVEVAGDTPDERDARAAAVVAHVDGQPHAVYDHPDAVALAWSARSSGAGAAPIRPGRTDRWVGWEDAAVPPEVVGPYLRDLRALLDDHGLEATLYGHFGDGCVHSRISFDHATPAGVAVYERFTADAADLVVSYGGSLSGEHGDGHARGDLLERMYGPDLVDAFRRFKRAFDPDGLLNPGRVVDPVPRTAGLRARPDGGVREIAGVLAHPAGSLTRELSRCVGIGTCRRSDPGDEVMCPSWQVTREEAHSTRGRAHLLYELLQPDADLDGWADDDVEAALDLCLSCKGCAVDCPAGVDVAAYKAEVRHRRHAERRRPLRHRLLGHVDRWLARASRTPRLANALAASRLAPPLLRTLGLDDRRPLPRLAPRRFRATGGARDRTAPRSGTTPRRDAGARPRVALFVDTFTDHLAPHAAVAAVRVLEATGADVVVAPEACCGRPLFDPGMLDEARAYLEELVATLHPLAAAGTPIVWLEPSCLSVVRDELPRLLAGDPRVATVAGACRSLPEHLTSVGWTPPRPAAPLLVHPHCHEHASLDREATPALLDAAGADWEPTRAGCCGLAGGFGFEAGHRDVSVAIGERRLAPLVRSRPDATVVADGFSCRTQVEHLVDGARPRHLAEVLADALDGPADDA